MRNKIGLTFIGLGLLFINFTLLDDIARQYLAFGSFFMASLLALPFINKDLQNGRISKSFLLGIALSVFVIFFSSIKIPYGEYGEKKFYYFLVVLIWGFVLFPLYFRDYNNLVYFCKILVIISVIFCFLAILFSNPAESRTGETGLNAAILARVCMICGIFSAVQMYYKGYNLLFTGILCLSVLGVFFTATKTPVPVFIFSFYLVLLKTFSIKQVFKHFFIIIIILLGAYLLLNYAVPYEYSSRILDPEGLSVENQSKEGNRLDLYLLAISVISDNPLGYGLGGFAMHHRFIVVPHNIFLEAAIEFGVLFAMILIGWIFIQVKKIKKMPLNNPYTTFIAVLFLYNVISFLFGGELTIQCLILYLTGNILWQYKTS